MGILAGPFVGASALLVLSGWLKVRRPTPTAEALRSAGLGALAPLARLFGVAEVVVGAGALAFDTRVLPALVAAFYLGFAAFVALSLLRTGPARRSGTEPVRRSGTEPTRRSGTEPVRRSGTEPAAGCGCFGESQSPPTVLHLVLNLAAAGVAAAVALGPGGGLPEVLRDQPFGGFPFVLLALTSAGLAYAALAVLPRTLEGARR